MNKLAQELNPGDVLLHGKMWRKITAVSIEGKFVGLSFTTGPDLLCMRDTEEVTR